MVQVLPAVPTFGSRLAGILEQAGGDLAKGFAERRTNQTIRRILGNEQDSSNNIDTGKQNQPGFNTQPISSQNQQPSENELIYLASSPNERVAKVAELKLNQLGYEKKEELKQRYKEKDSRNKIQTDIVTGFENASQSKAITNRLRALDQEGLPSNLPVYLSELLDIPVELWAPEQAQQFQKEAAQKATKVAQAFGFGNVRAIEFAEFVKTIPSLLNSKEGRERIYNTMDYFDNLAVERYDAYRDILKKNRDITGPELELELSEKMRPNYEKLSEVFTYGDELVEMKSPDGELGKVPKNQVEEAEKEGYVLVGGK